jgi:hypothetical protein
MSLNNRHFWAEGVGVRPGHGQLLQLAQRFNAWVERRGDVVFALFVLFVAICCAMLAASRPLDHDEIFTYYVSRLDGFKAIYSALLAHADNHPPIDYWIRHAVLILASDSQLAFRLPSLFAFVGCMICIYVLLREWAGRSCALAGVGVLVVSQAGSTAYFARSYALILLWCSFGLLLWRWATMGIRRRLCLFGLGLLFASSPCLHYYAPFHMAAIPVAQLFRSIQRRKLDLGVWIAVLGIFAGLPLVYPLLAFARSFSASFWSPVNLGAAFESYGEMFAFGLPAFVGILVGAVILYEGTTPEVPAAALLASMPEKAAAVYLALLPAVIFIVAKLYTHAFLAKYCLSAVIGIALLLGCAASRSLSLRVAALMCLLPVGAVIFSTKAAVALKEGHPSEASRSVYAIVNSTSLPVVFDAAQPFLEAGVYAPESIRRRLFYLYNREVAVKMGREDTDQLAMPGIAMISPLKAVPEEEFLATHRHFLLIYGGNWLLKDLLERKHASASLKFLNGLQVMEVRLDPPDLNAP